MIFRQTHVIWLVSLRHKFQHEIVFYFFKKFSGTIGQYLVIWSVNEIIAVFYAMRATREMSLAKF